MVGGREEIVTMNSPIPWICLFGMIFATTMFSLLGYSLWTEVACGLAGKIMGTVGVVAAWWLCCMFCAACAEP